MKLPPWFSWLRDSPWLFVLVGAVLALISLTHHAEFWGATFVFVEGVPLQLLGYGGIVLLVCGFVLGTVRLARHSPIRARPLLGTSAIYNESRRMVERCPSDEVIRATSISTKLPGDHEEDRPDVEAYLYTIASRCAEAKREGKNLLYKTVFGFGPRTADDPPEHKQRSITKRLDQFVLARAEDRLIMKYIETDWSLDVLITGQAEMLIAFPTLPADRHLQLGLKIENRAFVAQAIRWYDDCVLADAKDVTWRPSATVAVQDGVAVPSLSPATG